MSKKSPDFSSKEQRDRLFHDELLRTCCTSSVRDACGLRAVKGEPAEWRSICSDSFADCNKTTYLQT